MTDKFKHILIFNDISGLGNCSLGANLPVFAKLGHNAIPVVTATFSCQTGFVEFTHARNNNLTTCVQDILRHRSPDAVYVGFCVDNGLLAEVCDVLQHSDAYVFVDPILGDNGKLYSIFDAAYVAQMKQAVRFAHCISPNLTEACLLADVDYQALVAKKDEPKFLSYCGEVFADFLQKTGAQSAVVTGIECGNLIGNMVLQKGQSPRYVTNERVAVNYSGTGDVFSSVLLGSLLNGAELSAATQKAASFVCTAAQNTKCTDRRFGVEFAKVINLL